MTAASTDPIDVRAAYRHCEQVTRTQARNFSYGIRLLPAPKRRALSAVYAFARRIDDIGDGTLPAAQKLAALQAARQQLDALAQDVAQGRPAGLNQADSVSTQRSAGPDSGAPDSGAAGQAGRDWSAGDGAGDSAAGGSAAGDGTAGDIEAGGVAGAAGGAGDGLVLLALGDAARKYPIPLGAFGELIEGCEADVRGTLYPTFGDLEHYCRCVAGSIGRLSLGIFGSREPRVAEPLADALGVALQLTNILRDVREDYGNGRVYLPADDLASFGCALAPPAEAGQAGPGPAELPVSPALERLVRYEAQRALRWYADGLRLMPLLDRRSAACTGAMAGIYLRLLEQISARPAEALAHRMSLPPRAKAAVAARSLAGLAPRPRPGGPVSAPGPDPMTAREARP